MNSGRVRIADIAEELGLSTATVSNVIHGKTKKISDQTVQRVQELLEKREYIPSMAGILLAQNDSRIIGIVVNDHEKYGSHVLTDSFVASSLSFLSAQIEQAGYFMMVKVTKQLGEIVKFASMWNMEGLVIIGFCEQDYKTLRAAMRIPFVVYDGYFEETGRICNLKIDDYDGGRQVGRHFRQLGHKKAVCIADNAVCMDLDRYRGFCETFQGEQVCFLQVPMASKERWIFYKRRMHLLSGFRAAFCMSDYYAVDFMHFLQEQGMRIPQDMAVAGFDDSKLCALVHPALTSVRQDGKRRAELAVAKLQELKQGKEAGNAVLPVQLIVRGSTAAYGELPEGPQH